MALLGIGLLVGCSSEAETQPKEEPKEEVKKVTLSDADLSSKDFGKLVKKVNKDIDTVAVEEGNVTITMSKDKSYWNENEMVEQTAKKGIELMEKVFKNPSVQSIKIDVPVPMVDSKGNEEVETVVTVTWDRATHEEINYENFKNMVILEYPKFYEQASTYNIHAGIYNYIDEEYKAMMTINK